MLRHYYKERIKHAFRFRTRRGYGVHSPYMFNLIMSVLRDKKSNCTNYPNIRIKKGHNRKLMRITYRIINFLKVERIYAEGNRTTLLQSYIPNIKIETEPDYIKDSCFLWLDNNPNRGEFEIYNILNWAKSTKEHHSVLITNINKNNEQRQLWNMLSKIAKVKVEMMWCGLLIFDEKLQIGSYHLLP